LTEQAKYFAPLWDTKQIS